MGTLRDSAIDAYEEAVQWLSDHRILAILSGVIAAGAAAWSLATTLWPDLKLMAVVAWLRPWMFWVGWLVILIPAWFAGESRRRSRVHTAGFKRLLGVMLNKADEQATDAEMSAWLGTARALVDAAVGSAEAEMLMNYAGMTFMGGTPYSRSINGTSQRIHQLLARLGSLSVASDFDVVKWSGVVGGLPSGAKS